MNNSLIIDYHAKHENKGWYEVCRYPVDSELWSKQDRVFIDELLEIGDMVLTCGWSMWQVVKPV
jgi:hypothetical protein